MKRKVNPKRICLEKNWTKNETKSPQVVQRDLVARPPSEALRVHVYELLSV